MSDLFSEFVEDLLRIEGGYVNRSDDSGGPTNYGITQGVARAYGYRGDMRALPRSLAIRIYKEKYWDSMLLDQIEKLSPSIAIKLSDIGVNCGVQRSGEFLQRILNVMNNKQALYPDIRVDGNIGPVSVATLRKFLSIRKALGELVVIRGLNCLQGSHYITLAERREKDEAFAFGWLANRIS